MLVRTRIHDGTKPDPLPEDSKFVAVKAGLLARVLLMAFPSVGGQWRCGISNLDSLQLREQLWFYTKFPFNACMKNHTGNHYCGKDMNLKIDLRLNIAMHN